MCGAGHDGEPPEECHVCRHPLSGADIIGELHRIENVGTRQVERITANDEERRRQGYDLQTTFSFHRISGVKSRVIEDAIGQILSARFASAASVRRINKGLRRRKDQSIIGFWIDPKSGYWTSASPSQEEDEPSPTRFRQRITPVVEDRKNALLLRFSSRWLHGLGDRAESVIATIQHALARGVEAVYQLEEGEILVEPTPSRSDRRALLFYEAAEGGAGALSRLIEEKDAFRTVARKALEIMHYDPASFGDAAVNGASALVSVTDARCVAGCYRCLLSYFNQPDHENIDRRQEPALELLLRLAFAEAHGQQQEASQREGLNGCPPPDAEAIEIDGYRIKLIWRSARMAAVEQDTAPPKISEKLAAKGIELVLLPSEKGARGEALAHLTAVLEGNGA
jgi:hypothetical protein